MNFNLKKIIPQTLFARSLLIIITPALLLQLMVGIFFFDRHWDAMTERLAQAVAGEISLALQTFDSQDNSLPEQGGEVVFLDGFKTALNLQFFYDPNATILDNWRADSTLIIDEIQTFQNELDRVLAQNFIIQSDREEKWYQVLIQMQTGVLRVNFPERRLYTATSYIFLLWMLGSSSLFFAIAILFMRNQVRPIQRLAMAADRFGRGIDVPKFKPHGAREVRQAATAFMDMRERIQRQIEQRTAMLSGVSHDLRTPITRMKLQLEMMDQDDDIKALRQDLIEMEAMIQGYLAFAKGDADERHSAIDIGFLLEKLVEKLERQALDIEIVKIESGHILRLRQGAVERALSNLITNACKYGDKAWISLYKNDDFIEITIDDKGPGIATDKHEDVFKPFYRLEDSRNSETGGLGLGLAVSQDIIHSHGGEIHLSTSNHGGLQVTVRLPLK